MSLRLISLSFLVAFSLLLSSGCKNSLLGQAGDDVARAEDQRPSTPPPPVSADGVRTSYADVVERTSPAIVEVDVKVKSKPQEEEGGEMPFGMPFPFPQAPNQQQPPGTQRGTGSGVIVSADGTILTNHHVVNGATEIVVTLTDKRSLTAKVVGSDKLSDLAVLKVEEKGLPFVPLGDSDKVRVGDIVLAIGNPLGVGQTVTQGIISAKGRRTGLGDGSFEDFLQTDAPINRGNSGGGLLNLSGELIGINSQILSPSGGSIGIGFSIPSNMAKGIMEQLLADGKVTRGQLGIRIQTITEKEARSLDLKDTKGALVSDVNKDSAAEKAGVKVGDVIIAINGEKIEDGNSLRNKVASTKPGADVRLTLIREGKEMDLGVKLDEFSEKSLKGGKPSSEEGQAEEKESGKLGLGLQPLTPQMAKRLEVSPDTKGMVVTDVDPNGPAADAGIRKGDLILKINNQVVESFEDVSGALEKSGDKPAMLLVSRGGQNTFVAIDPQK